MVFMDEQSNISHRPTTANADQTRKQKLLGVLFVLISAVSWGVSGTVAQYLTQGQDVQVEWLSCVRMIGAGVLLLPWALSHHESRAEIKRLLRNKKDVRDIVIYAIFGIFACQIGYLFTIAYTNSGTSTMFEQLGMIIVVAVTCLSLRRWPTRREVIALILALGGALCICTQGSIDSLALPPEGLAWGIFAAFGMATYVLLPVRLLKSYRGLSVTALAMCIAGVAVSLGFRPWNIMPPLSFEVVAGTLATILLGTVIAYLFFL